MDERHKRVRVHRAAARGVNDGLDASWQGRSLIRTTLALRREYFTFKGRTSDPTGHFPRSISSILWLS